MVTTNSLGNVPKRSTTAEGQGPHLSRYPCSMPFSIPARCRSALILLSPLVERSQRHLQLLQVAHLRERRVCLLWLRVAHGSRSQKVLEFRACRQHVVEQIDQPQQARSFSRCSKRMIATRLVPAGPEACHHGSPLRGRKEPFVRASSSRARCIRPGDRRGRALPDARQRSPSHSWDPESYLGASASDHPGTPPGSGT